MNRFLEYILHIDTIFIEMQPIKVNYNGKLFKTKTKRMINSFFNRFYTPYIFLLWFIVSFNFDNCTSVPTIITCITIIASAQNSYYSYIIWHSDIMLLTDANEPKIRGSSKLYLILSEFLIHSVCIILSIWWIDDLHLCIQIERTTQGFIWIVTLIIAMVLHVTQYKIKNKQMELIARNVYKHVQSSSSSSPV